MQAGRELLAEITAADSTESALLDAARTAHERGALDDILTRAAEADPA